MVADGQLDLEAPGQRTEASAAVPTPSALLGWWGRPRRGLSAGCERADVEDDRSTRYEPSACGGRSPGGGSCPTPARADDEVSVSSAESSLAQPLLAVERGSAEPRQGPYRASLLVVLPAFAAYACLFALQHEVKVVYGIADDDSAASHEFGFATSSLFAFKLLFRFLHSVLFGRWAARGRLYVGMAMLAAAMLLLTAVTSGFLRPQFQFIFIAYALGGAGVGTFEGNVLSSFTFLGPDTKKYAVMGMPLGVASITIGAFWLRYLGVPVCLIYGFMALAILGSAGVLFAAIPAQPSSQCRLTGLAGVLHHQPSVALGMRSWRKWLPFMASRFVAALADMAILEVFCPGLLLFVYDTPELSLLLPPVWPREVRVAKDLFFVLYNLCTAAGGLSGRLLAFRVRRVVNPVWFVALMLLGAALVIGSLPGHTLSPLALLLVPLGGFLVLFGDGMAYVMICRAIDDKLPQDITTAAYSTWLFTADLGSNIGANSIAFVRDLVAP